MKIDLTAAADVVPLNSVDVERGRIAQHIRQADGEIAAGARKRRLNRFKLTKCSKSRNGSSWLTYCSRRAANSSVTMASRHSTNTPPSCSRMQTASLPGSGGQCCGSGYCHECRGPLAPSSLRQRRHLLRRRLRHHHLHRGRGLRRMRSPFQGATIEEVRLAVGLPLGLRFLAKGLSKGESDRRSSPCGKIP